LLCPLSTEFDQSLTIELGEFQSSQGFFQRLQDSRLGASGRAADLMHIFDMKVDDVAERSSLCSSLRFWRPSAVNIALHVERPIFTVLATAEVSDT
jgi:hypothetical protein